MASDEVKSFLRSVMNSEHENACDRLHAAEMLVDMDRTDTGDNFDSQAASVYPLLRSLAEKAEDGRLSLRWNGKKWAVELVRRSDGARMLRTKWESFTGMARHVLAAANTAEEDADGE